MTSYAYEILVRGGPNGLKGAHLVRAELDASGFERIGSPEPLDPALVGSVLGENFTNLAQQNEALRKELDELRTKLAHDGQLALAPSLAAAIKVECGRRIDQIANDAAQKNMMANAIAGNFLPGDMAAWKAGVDWIKAMLDACRALIAAGDVAYGNDSKWPPCPPEAQALAARY